MAPTFGQFLRERWGRIVLFTVGWAVLWLALMPHAPHWVQWAANVVIWMSLAYQIGVLRTQARYSRELSAERKTHIEDIERFVAFLMTARGDLAEIKAVQAQIDGLLQKEQAH